MVYLSPIGLEFHKGPASLREFMTGIQVVWKFLNSNQKFLVYYGDSQHRGKRHFKIRKMWNSQMLAFYSSI